MPSGRWRGGVVDATLSLRGCSTPPLRPCPLRPAPAPQGNVSVVGRRSQYSLYSPKIASFEDDQGAYDQKDAAGFIKLQVRALPSQESYGLRGVQFF